MDATEGSVTPAMRHKARHFALQAIYQWQLTGESPTEIEKQFLEDQPIKGTDLEYFHDILCGVVNNAREVDEIFAPHLSRPLDGLDQVDKAILRLGTFELLYRQEVPYRVVINESIILAKEFAEQDSHKFVNGVLDKVVKGIKK
ncbi:MAG: transcription antitermination factor NusB [Aeromonadales bacterium]|nr:transcription antitermination factor NusB [Aeromonadales bacterium]